jgi:hypothetical protein
MEHWQFLIQRQGDRAWHTLESPKVEIIEGRYRVLARSNRPNTDVEVRVIHSSTQEVPPKRRVQKRSRRTNSEGLMAVIPYTYFKPGIWELQCSGDLMSDIFGKSWQYNAYLRVLPQNADVEVTIWANGNGGELNLPTNPDASLESNLVAVISVEPTSSLEASVTETSELVTTVENTSTTNEAPVNELEEDAIIDLPVSPVWVKGGTAEQILQNLIDLALPSSEPLLDEEMLAEPEATQTLPPLLLNLDQAAYVAHWGQDLAISGRVELQQKADLAVEIPYLDSLYSLELKISLRSPLQSEILNQVKQSLPNEVLPFKIKSSIYIPAECESKLILADISLSGALTDGGEVTLLASHSFTITADFSELLAVTLATPSTPAPEVVETACEVAESSLGIDLSLLNLVKAVKPEQSLAINTTGNKFLPPEIKPRSRKKSLDSHRALDLPNMPPLPKKQDVSGILTEFVTAELAKQEENSPKTETLAAIDMNQLVIKNPRLPMIASTFPYLKPLTESTGDSEAVSNSPPSENSQTLDVTLGGSDQINSQFPDESFAEVATPPRSKLIDAYIAEVATPPRPELIDELATATPPPAIPELIDQPDTVTATPPRPELIDEWATGTPTPPIPELIDQPALPTVPPPPPKLVIEGNPYSSPLITKWLQNQGFSLPEPIQVQAEDDDMDIVEQQTPGVEQNLPSNSDGDTEIPADWLAIAQQDLETAENLSKEYSTPPLLEPPPPPPRYRKIPLMMPIEEIVVDDVYIEPVVEAPPEVVPQEEEVPVPAVPEPSRLQKITGKIVELLPTPKLHVPEGELTAGTSVRVRVELPQIASEVVVKLWIEDCQSRCLMDGPHLLKDLRSNSSGGLEVTTQLDIPFGCLEMRVEAIALDPQTQQESHKVTITRTVIPPDLPTLPLDEMLGI